MWIIFRHKVYIETSLKLSRNITIASQKSSFEHNENVSASEPVSTENIDIVEVVGLMDSMNVVNKLEDQDDNESLNLRDLFTDFNEDSSNFPATNEAIELLISI